MEKRKYTIRPKRHPMRNRKSKAQRLRRSAEKQFQLSKLSIDSPASLSDRQTDARFECNSEDLLMDVTEEDFITADKEPKKNLQYSKIPLPQDNTVPKIYKIIVMQSHPLVKQTLCNSAAIESISKSKPVVDGVLKGGGIVYSFNNNVVDKTAHHADENVHRNETENSVNSEISKRKSAKPSRIFKYENNESVIVYSNTLRKDITVSQEHKFCGRPQQHVSQISEEKSAGASVIPSCTSVTEDTLISQDTSKGKYDFNFIKNYWMAAFASNPEYGLYELPPQNGYCCPFCDFVGKDSNGVLIHWRQHFGEQQFSSDYQGESFFSGQHSSAKHLHGRLRANQCHLCLKKFSKNRLLQKHMVCHYKSEPFKCNICNKAFFLKHSLDSHIKIHTNTKYKCPQCEKVYTYEISLKRHVRTVHQT